jgi:hypothetical protein
VSASLALTRGTNFAFELRRGQFRIILDGQDAGSIANGESTELPLTPGQHTLRISVGRYSSREISFDVADGHVASFRCHGAALWPRFVASLVKPDLAISLARQ